MKSRFRKPSIEASIEVYNNDIFFNEHKPTEVLGEINVKLKKPINVKSFKIYLIGDLFEMYYGKYPKCVGEEANDTRDTIRRQFKQSTLLDYRLPYNVSHMTKGVHKFPFEIGLYLAQESLVSNYALVKYSLRFELITTDNDSIARFCDLNVVKSINIKPMNYIGRVNDDLFNYHLDINNMLFLNQPYHLVLKVGKREVGIDDLDITNLELSLIQTCQISYLKFDSRSTNADPIDATTVDQEDELKMGTFTPEAVITSNDFTKDKYYRVFDINCLFQDCYEAERRNCLEFVHPTFTSNYFECYHSLKFKINFNDGLSHIFHHAMEIRHCESFNGNVCPPDYIKNCRDKCVDIDSYALPPHYEDIKV